jgi:PAS domain S-box-containing protein
MAEMTSTSRLGTSRCATCGAPSALAPDSEHLALIVEAAPIAIVVTDAIGVLRLVNGHAQALFGYDRDELLGQPLEMLLPERFRGGHPALRSEYAEAASPRTMGAGRDLFALRKDGSEVPIETGLSPFQTPEGLFVLAALIDISEGKQADEHLRLIIDAAPNATILIDSAGRIDLVNAEAERLFGYTRFELLGRPVDVLLPERLRRGHAGLRASYLTAPSTRKMGAGRELYGLRRDGSEVPIEIGLGPITTPRGQFVLASIIDIAERKHAESLRFANACVLAQNAELEALNNELESFSYSVSHDLRAPARAIHGYARMLEKRYAHGFDAEGQRLLNVVLSEASRMGVLIDEILGLSRLGRQAMRITSLDMDSIVRGIVDDLTARTGATGVVFQLEALPRAFGDLVQLQRVWENVLSNAVKYCRQSTPPTVRVWGESDEDNVVYHVEDNGVGFDMKYASKLFGAFQRLHASDEFAGTGIGLAIVHRVIVRHHGRVWADAEVGRGARFSFSLPSVSSHE